MHYFKQKELGLHKNSEEEIAVTKIVTSLTNNILNAQLTLDANEEMQKSVKHFVK